MKRTGAAHGINFSYGGLLGNTFNSHRLVELAAEKDPSLKLQDKVVEALFHCYFESEGDINDPATLASIATSAGLFDNEDDAKNFLASQALTKEVCRTSLSCIYLLAMTHFPTP